MQAGRFITYKTRLEGNYTYLVDAYSATTYLGFMHVLVMVLRIHLRLAEVALVLQKINSLKNV